MVLMHALKHSSGAVNGVLLGKVWHANLISTNTLPA
jgi:hypothetical protein